MTVKIKTFGSMEDANEWFKEGRPKRIAAVCVILSAEAELSRPAAAMAGQQDRTPRHGVGLDEQWRNAACAYAQIGMNAFGGGVDKLPPADTTLRMFDTLSPVREGHRTRVPSAMAGALARIMVVHSQHVAHVEQFCHAIMDAATAAQRDGTVELVTAYQWNAKALVEFWWSLYADRSLRKNHRRKIIYRATAAAFFNALQGVRVVKFSTSIPTSDCIVK